MQIANEDQYQDAVTELKRLAEASADDEAAQTRKQELEAATAMYTETLKSQNPRKGRPNRNLTGRV